MAMWTTRFVSMSKVVPRRWWPWGLCLFLMWRCPWLLSILLIKLQPMLPMLGLWLSVLPLLISPWRPTYSGSSWSTRSSIGVWRWSFAPSWLSLWRRESWGVCYKVGELSFGSDTSTCCWGWGTTSWSFSQGGSFIWCRQHLVRVHYNDQLVKECLS